jgi:hypothetical protein
VGTSGEMASQRVAGLLLTDPYELRMAASYLRRRMEGLATFSLFVPFKEAGASDGLGRCQSNHPRRQPRRGAGPEGQAQIEAQ